MIFKILYKTPGCAHGEIRQAIVIGDDYIEAHEKLDEAVVFPLDVVDSFVIPDNDPRAGMGF